MMGKKEYNNLESRFKLLAETQEFEYQPQDWSALEVRLDKEETNRRPYFIYLVFGMLSVMAITIGLKLSMTNNGIGNTTLHKNSSVISNQKPTPQAIDKNEIELNKEAESKLATQVEQSHQGVVGIPSTSNPETIVEENKTTVNNTEPHNAELVGEPAAQQSIETEDNISAQNKFAAQGTVKTQEPKSNEENPLAEIKDENPVGEKVTEPKRDLPISNTQESTTQVADAQIIPTTRTANEDQESDKEVLPILLLSSTDKRVELDSNIDKVIGEVQNRLEVESINYAESSGIEVLPPRPKFILNANLGVEAAKTPLGDRSDADINLGFKVGYVAGSNLVLSAGLNYVKEGYVADGDDYSPPVGFWQNFGGTVPDEILAVCDMIDLSIGAAYHFSEVNDNGLVAQVNFISNYMVREEYDYRFSDPGSNDTFIFSGENQTLFSNAELGLAYKFKVGNRLIIDAGSYVKIPTRGIGHGSMRLTTVGVRLGISLLK